MYTLIATLPAVVALVALLCLLPVLVGRAEARMTSPYVPESDPWHAAEWAAGLDVVLGDTWFDWGPSPSADPGPRAPTEGRRPRGHRPSVRRPPGGWRLGAGAPNCHLGRSSDAENRGATWPAKTGNARDPLPPGVGGRVSHHSSDQKATFGMRVECK